MWYLVAFLTLALAAPVDVTVTKLDGTNEVGRLQSWTGDGIEVLTAAGKETIARDELLEVKLSNRSSADTAHPQLELVDGSLLPIRDFAAQAQSANIQLSHLTSGDDSFLTVPLKKIRAVRLISLEPEAAPQWAEIRSLNLPSDVVVVAKRGGKSLDHLECVVGTIGKDEVELTVDGQKMRVARSKVAGVIYYRSDEPRPASAIVSGIDGLRIAAAGVRLVDDSFAVTTTGDVETSWPLTAIAAIDMSAGKVAYLSDLQPASSHWLPLIGLPPAATRILRAGEPRFNQSANGGELALAYRDPNPAVGSPEIKTFAKGLAVRSRSELTYRPPAGYTRFLAEAGIDPNDSANGNVLLTIYGDDRPLLEQSIDGSDAPVSLDLDVAGVKRLRIVVDYGKNLDTGDWLNLCNARIVK